MEWNDEGIVLSVRPHAETAAVATLLTREHGRHAGLVHGAAARRRRGLLETGNHVAARWRGRLPEQLGSLSIEPIHAYAPPLLDAPLRLAALQSAAAVAATGLPEREPHPPIFDGLIALCEVLVQGEGWEAAYIRWELGVLAELGFGLDLRRCAATGGNDQLAYVSPRTGRAVSLSAGEPFRDRLLRLPPFLVGGPGFSPADVVDGLALTEHFLERCIFSATHAALPPARVRLAESCARAAHSSAIVAT